MGNPPCNDREADAKEGSLSEDADSRDVPDCTLGNQAPRIPKEGNAIIPS